MKSIGKAITLRAWRRLWPATTSEFFSDYSSALAACGRGYDDPLVAAVVAAKTAELSHHRYELPPLGVLLGASALVQTGRPLRVIDIGGAAGAHYLDTRRIVPPETTLDWTIVETPAMVAAAREMPFNREVRFEVSLSEALTGLEGAPDLILVSGVLMCLPDPEVTLQDLVRSGSKAIVFSRTGLSPDATRRIIVQSSLLSSNGVGPLPGGFTDQVVKFPNTFIPIAEFERAVEERYAFALKVVERESAWTTVDVGIHQYAYLAFLRDHGANSS